MTLEELFHQSLEALPLILRGLGKEKRLSPEELEDLRSDIQLKLLENGYRVLRLWNKRSSFKVYLVTVVYNIWRDRVRAEKGTVRVSAAGKRLGPAAEKLEILMGRGLKFDEAYRLIKPLFPGLSRGEAEEIAAQINPRPGRRFESEDVVARLPDLEQTGDKRLEQEEKLVKKHEALALMRQRLSELPEQDRILLVRVHAEGVKFSHIARSLGGIDQRSLYRRNEGLITKLRTDLEEAGIRWEDLSEVLGIDEGEALYLRASRAERPGMMAVTKTCSMLTASFLDGSLLGDERNLIVWHLNGCTDCFERYIGSARLLDAIEEEEASALSAANENRAVEPSLLRGVKVLKKLNRNFSHFSPYGRAFHRAGFYFAKLFREGRGNFLDSEVLTVVYPYRQALQLYLKGIILAGNNLMRQMGEGLSEEETMDRIASGNNPHGLLHLLPEVGKVFLFASIHIYNSGAKNVDDIDFGDRGPIRNFSDLRRYIEDFDNIDPTAVATRYPIEKESKSPSIESYAYTLEGYDDSARYSVNKFVEITDSLVKFLGGFTAQLENWERKQEEELLSSGD
jgi:RNA polymerase sigma factor (sigma-70 family)